MVFAYDVSIGETTYSFNEQSGIPVIVSEELNIVIPASMTTTTVYLDIPANRIERFTTEVEDHPSKVISSPMNYLTIWLFKSTEETFYLNARGCSADSIRLAFTLAKSAFRVLQSLARINHRLAEDPRGYLSQLNNVSRHSQGDARKHPAAQPAEAFPGNMVNGAVQADSQLHQKSMTSVAILSFGNGGYGRVNDVQLVDPPWTNAKYQKDAPQISMVMRATSPIRLDQSEAIGADSMNIEPIFQHMSKNAVETPTRGLNGVSPPDSESVSNNRLRSPTRDCDASLKDCTPFKNGLAEREGEDATKHHTMSNIAIFHRRPLNHLSPPFDKSGKMRVRPGQFEQHDMAKGTQNDQQPTRLSQQAHGDIDEPPVGLLKMSEPLCEEATRTYDKKDDDEGLELKRIIPLSTKNHTVKGELSRTNNNMVRGEVFRAEYLNDNDEDEFDLPSSAPKVRLSAIVRSSTSRAATSIQKTSKTVRKPKKKSITVSKSQFQDSSIISGVQSRKNAISTAVVDKFSPLQLKKAQENTEHHDGERLYWNTGCVDEAEGLCIPQQRREQPLKQQSQQENNDRIKGSFIKTGNQDKKSVEDATPIVQRRSRRVAAVNAKKKIQCLVESETEVIEEEDYIEPLLDTRQISAPPEGEFGGKSGNPRPSLLLGKDSERHFADPHNKTKSVHKINISGSDDIDLVAKDPIRPRTKLSTNNEPNKEESMLLTTSTSPRFENQIYRTHNDSPYIQPESSSTCLNKVEDNASNGQEIVEGPKYVHLNEVPRSLSLSLSVPRNESLVPETFDSDHFPMGDSAEDNFFEEAIAFTYQDTTNFTSNSKTGGSLEASTLASKQVTLNNPELGYTTDSNISRRIAKTPTAIMTSKPNLHVAAKLQSALSSIGSPQAQKSKLKASLLGTSKPIITTPALLAASHSLSRTETKIRFPAERDVARPRDVKATGLAKNNAIGSPQKNPRPMKYSPDSLESDGGLVALSEPAITVEDSGRIVMETPQAVRQSPGVAGRDLVPESRKSNIISFSSKGPRNQGVIPGRGRRPLEMDQAEGFSRTSKYKLLKRKIADVDEPVMTLEKGVAAVKRPRGSIDVPRTRDDAPQSIHKRRISMVQKSTQKIGSQSTRVDENGSPLPFVPSQNTDLSGHEHPVSAEDDVEIIIASKQMSNHEDGQLIVGEMSSVSNLCVPLLQSHQFTLAPQVQPRRSNNAKSRPGSSYASFGITEKYTAHKVHSSGKFVNVRTDNVVVATRPADPFVETKPNHSNNFINLLRRSSYIFDKQVEDPDKTLIGSRSAKRAQRDNKSVVSSSSDSSQTGDPSCSEESSASGGAEQDEWGLTLQPHQEETLDVLLEISHVSRIFS